MGQEEVINIDEDATFDFYDTLPKESSVYREEKIKSNPDKDRNVDYFVQVGAFSEESPADNLKAKLALM